MKQKIIIAAIISFIVFNSYSQTTYENGYVIYNNDKKTTCLIKNSDWKNNPTEISLKFSESEEVNTVTIASIKEFVINGKVKYQRHKVNIDKSSNILSSLNHNRSPVFNEEQLFLKVLIQGKAILYSYKGNNIEKFFFKSEDTEIEQLIYKHYLTGNNEIATNSYFKQQILNTLHCPSISITEIQNLDYKENKLIHLFIKYNDCVNSEYLNYSIKEKKNMLNFYLKAGFKNSSLEISNSTSALRDTDFGSKLGLGIGLEAEIVFHFNNNKWSLIIEPTYQSFNSKIETSSLTSEVNYSSIEIPFGIRHYMFISKKSKLFMNGLIIMDFNLNSKFNFKRQYESTLEIKSGTNLAIGFGYNYDNKYSAELRYHTKRDLLTNYGPWDSKYNSVSLIFGYSIF